MKKWIGAAIIGLLGVLTGISINHSLNQDRLSRLEGRLNQVMETRPMVHTNFHPQPLSTANTAGIPPNFIAASASSTPAVVHIKSFYESSGARDPFSGLFGGRDPFHGGSPEGGQSSGSGVIISEDGYITTNNHVIEDAEKVEVTLEDKRSYEAQVIGKDPTTDLALLKIEEHSLPYLTFGNSNDIQIGEWVLAVGNPFNLTSTVTAGIVSAKGRSLNLLNEEFAIESFIQTDAAVNPGNSGGALINTDGKLLGINTAIASRTGSYAGYSFAVPVNIVHKVMADLREFGEVQRGIIGVQIRNINAQFAEERGLTTLNGAYIQGTIPGGAAEDSGIEQGDVIVQVESTKVNSASELQEIIGTYRPGDKVQIDLVREGKNLSLSVTLRNRQGDPSP